MACLPPDALDRCTRCQRFRYFDVGEPYEAGPYICSGCKSLMSGKRMLTREELEQRVHDLELIVANFAQQAAA